MIVYVLFVQKKIIFKEKSLYYSHTKLKIKKNPKKHFQWVFKVFFFVLFGWVFLLPTLLQVRREGKETSTPERTTAEAGLDPKTEELRLEASSEVVCVARVGAADQRIVSCSLEQASTLDMGKPLHSLVIPGMSWLPCMPSINSRFDQYRTVLYRANDRVL
jgi:hypothetical protein